LQIISLALPTRYQFLVFILASAFFIPGCFDFNSMEARYTLALLLRGERVMVPTLFLCWPLCHVMTTQPLCTHKIPYLTNCIPIELQKAFNPFQKPEYLAAQQWLIVKSKNSLFIALHLF